MTTILEPTAYKIQDNIMYIHNISYVCVYMSIYCTLVITHVHVHLWLHMYMYISDYTCTCILGWDI